MLLGDLPSHYDNTIRKSLIAMTTNGLYAQAAKAYTDCLAAADCANGNKSYAATYAKMFISNNFVPYGSPVASALRDYALENGNLPAMTNLFNDNYQSPLLKFWMNNTQNGIQFNTDGNLVGTNGSVFQLRTIDMTPFVGLQPVGTMPTNITAGLREQGRAQLTPFSQNAFGTPAAAGSAPRLILNGGQITNTGGPMPPANLRGM